jgi:ubiquitin-protein ligase
VKQQPWINKTEQQSRMTFLARLQSELRQLENDPPPGIAAWPKSESNICDLEASEMKS